MANTFELIYSYTATGSVANISFTSIPATYTDLVLKMSLRSSVTNSSDPYDLVFTLNSTSTIASKVLRFDGSTASSNSNITDRILRAGAVPSNWTANTFSNGEIYIPNYAGSQNKSWSSDAVTENNATLADMSIVGGLTSIAAAITSITIAVAGNIVEHSTAYLYGVSNA